MPWKSSEQKSISQYHVIFEHDQIPFCSTSYATSSHTKPVDRMYCIRIILVVVYLLCFYTIMVTCLHMITRNKDVLCFLAYLHAIWACTWIVFTNLGTSVIPHILGNTYPNALMPISCLSINLLNYYLFNNTMNTSHCK